MKNIFENFTNCYPVQKTLRFNLIPIGETEDNIKNMSIISKDEDRSLKYQDVKPLFDRCHQNFIEIALNEYTDNWSDLYDAIEKFRKDKSKENKDKLDGIQNEYQERISKFFIKHEQYKTLDPKSIIDKAVKNELKGFSDEEIKTIASFNRFSTYFTGYKENRENIYKVDIASSVAYRTINENFPKFISNVELFKKIPQEVVSTAELQLKELLNGYNLNDVFSVEFFNNVISQSGIDFYNNLLGGYSKENNIKIQGLNEILNQAELEKKFKFSPLYKQILSDREAVSFIPSQFESDSEMASSIMNYSEGLALVINDNKEAFREIFIKENINPEKIFINKKSIPELSMLLYDNQWDTIRNKLYDANIKQQSNYMLSQIQSVCDKDILQEFYNIYINLYNEIEVNLNSIGITKETKSINDYENIKKYLDSVNECENLLKTFAASDDMDKDSVFYSVFDDVYSIFRESISLYNKVRNYATRKPFLTEKFKLTFDKSDFLNSWSQDYSLKSGLLFRCNGLYYLGIVDKSLKKEEQDALLSNTEISDFEQFIYDVQKPDKRNIPRLFIHSKGDKYAPAIEKYTLPIDEVIDIYDNEYFKTEYRTVNPIKYKESLIKMIDYFKLGFQRHDSYKHYNFKWKKSDEYKDIKEFYDDVMLSCYELKFRKVNTDILMNYVSLGKIYLFQIYNKDFSEYSTGKKNLHTLYWEQLFSSENLNNVVYKLNGKAELFYRKASIDNPFVHKKNSILIKKRYKNNKSVDEGIYEQALADVNRGTDIEALKKKYPELCFRKAPHDITKDKRYTRDEFKFHVPITINYAVKNKFNNFNSSVLEAIKNNPDVNIIGIDRGERNLLCVSLINQKGEILDQKSYNIVNNTDYHEKLDRLENQRDDARKNWKAIGNIKDVKEGYLSQVIHELTEMMVNNNAIIVMENLNRGFKRGRFHIEKQVYQKFEKMLIDKLNLYANKSIPANECGGIRRAYQLTSKLEGGEQTGFIFYIPASYTSKIDPITGFVNLFSIRQTKYQGKEKAKEFFRTFDSIQFNKSESYFEFEFDYSKFDLYRQDYTNKWTVCTAGNERVVYTKIDGRDSSMTINVTEEMKALFNKYGISFENTENIKDAICEINTPEFYEKLLWLFKITVQLRYEDKENDYILSPIKTEYGFFDSRTAPKELPQDGDCNGAYHIALQGLRLITERIRNDKVLPDEKGKQEYNWFKFAQAKPFKK